MLSTGTEKLVASREYHEVDQSHDPRCEQEGVALQVAKLEEAKDKPQTPHRSTARADKHTIDNPFVRKRAKFCEEVLRAGDERSVKLVEVKLLLERRNQDRVLVLSDIQEIA